MSIKQRLHSDEFYYNPNWQPPEIVYGENLIARATGTEENYVVITMEIPWELVKDQVVKKPVQVVFVPNMYVETLQSIEQSIPDDIQMVMGIGGGSSHDCAKYVALKKNIRLVQVPTIFGGDAVVCSAIGIRQDRRVKYIAHTSADKIYVDFSLIRNAPEKLVRFGAADILSSYTALLDWKLTAKRGKEKYNDKAAEYARNELLGKLQTKAYYIKNLTDEGIKTIVELFIEYARLANKIGTDRAQEGSEHFFCYNAEYLTKRTYVHGALLSLGIWVIASFFYDYQNEIEGILDSLGLEYNLESAGLSEEEFRQVLLTLNKFVQDGGYYYSIICEKNIDDEFVNKVLKNMKN